MKKIVNDYLKVLRVRNVLVLTIATFLYSLSFYNTTYTLFLKNRGLSYWEIFMLETVISASVFIFEVPSGYIADRIGRRKTLIFSIVCYAVSAYITALGHSFFAFILLSAIFGIGIASMSGADSALIYESLSKADKKEYSDSAFALIGGAMSLAMIISLPVGGILSAYSLELPVYITCIPLTLAIIASFFLKEERIDVEKSNEKREGFKTSFKFILKEQPMLLVLESLNSIAFSVILSMAYLNQPLFLECGIPVEYFGFIMLAANVLSMSENLVSPWLKSKIGTPALMFIGYFIPGILILALCKTVSVPVIIISYIGISSISSVTAPVFKALCNDNIIGRNRATMLSMISFIGSLIGMCIKPLIGYLSDLGLNKSFFILGISMIFVAAGFLIVVPVVQKNKELDAKSL